jgi:hypothetical protein
MFNQKKIIMNLKAMNLEELGRKELKSSNGGGLLGLLIAFFLFDIRSKQ